MPLLVPLVRLVLAQASVGSDALSQAVLALVLALALVWPFAANGAPLVVLPAARLESKQSCDESDAPMAAAAAVPLLLLRLVLEGQTCRHRRHPRAKWRP